MTRTKRPAKTACPHTVRRRTFLAGAAVAALAGCLSGATPTETAPPTPIALDGGEQCDGCGMVIADHPGPNGQLFYQDHAPEGHDNPAWFDSVKELFAYHFEKQRLDWEALVVYATDYSAVDYSLSTERGTTYLSSHTSADSFADATELVFLVGSDVHGAMGPDLIPFSVEADATALAADHGGEVVAFEDVDEGTLAR